MKIIGSKTIVKDIIAEFLGQKSGWISDDCIAFIHRKILKQKIRFPLLDFFSEEVFQLIPPKQLFPFIEKIVALDEIGSYVIAGKMLQLNLDRSFSESHKKANDFILKGNVWYACDIISERILGVMLLNFPEKTITICKSQSNKENQWLIRSVGVATHYAVKKGLSKPFADEQFKILLSKANVSGYHAITGIGWAAKTVAKFHPDIIKKYQKEIDQSNVKHWFRSKVKIGLGRSFKYASKFL